MGSTKLLDHGYLKVIEHWGSDERIIEAARMSTDKGFEGWGPTTMCSRCEQRAGSSGYYTMKDGTERMTRKYCGDGSDKDYEHQWVRVSGDEKLLKYLYDNKHATPFEFAGLVIEVQAPIFVFREWHRHRTQSYNEMSARYTPLPDLNYVPTIERLMLNSRTNKQAGAVKGAEELTEEGAEFVRAALKVKYQEDEELYQVFLRRGVPKELARIHLPVGRYSRMRASTCLRNWLAFLTLRQAPNAQWEIRQYADAVNVELASLFSRTMELFNGLKPSGS